MNTSFFTISIFTLLVYIITIIKVPTFSTNIKNDNYNSTMQQKDVINSNDNRENPVAN